MPSPPERSPERDAALEATLVEIGASGWNLAALRNAAGPDADLLFPGGQRELIEAFFDLLDRRMAEAAAAIDFTGVGLTARVRRLVMLRLQAAQPHRRAIQRATAILLLPTHARLAARITARSADAIWFAAGDKSADFSWYTKRAILGGILAATQLFWLRDMSEDDADTLGFLDRRLAGIGQIGKWRSRLRGRLRPTA